MALTGVDVSWEPPLDYGTGITGYIVHRWVGGLEATYDVSAAEPRYWSDVQAPAGATYAVSAVSEGGEGPASAAAPAAGGREALVVTAPRENMSVFPRLGAVAVPYASHVVPLDEDVSLVRTTAVAVSPDGRQLVYVRSADAEPMSLWTWRAGTPGSSPKQLWANEYGVFSPAWSPDGSRIAFAAGTEGSIGVYVIPATGGTPVLIGNDLTQPTWLPDARTLVARDLTGGAGYPLVRVAAVPGASRSVIAGPVNASHPRVSPDGRWIAFVPPYEGRPNHVAVVPVGGGAVRRGVDTDFLITGISWSPDSARLAILSHASYGPARLRLAPVSIDGLVGAAEPMQLQDAQRNIESVAWQGFAITIAPVKPVLSGSVSLPFDASALLPGSQVTCRLDDAPATACTSPFARKGVVSGTHTLRITGTEPGGREVVAVRSFVVDATPPSAQLSGPTYTVTTADRARVSYSASDASGVASYDVRYRRARFDSGFGAHVYPSSWTRVTGTSVSLGLAAGYENCVSMRARDRLGNTSNWTAERCFARALDDRALTTSASWVRVTGSAFYLGTAARSDRNGATVARSTVRTRRITLLATRCPTCGKVAVYVGTTKVGVVSLYASTTQHRRWVALPALRSVQGGRLRIIVVSATGRPVYIDGVALRRS